MMTSMKENRLLQPRGYIYKTQRMKQKEDHKVILLRFCLPPKKLSPSPLIRISCIVPLFCNSCNVRTPLQGEAETCGRKRRVTYMTKCLWDDFTESMHLAANMEGRIGLYLCN